MLWKSLTVLHSPDLEVKYIGGIDPRMLFLDDAGEEKEVCSFVVGPDCH